jgi:hypothetical protein
MNSPATHLDETALRVAERATMERIRNELYRSNQDRWFQPQEFSSDFFTGVQNSFRYLSEQNDEHTDIRNIRPIGARISQESPNTQRVKVAVQSPKVSNHSDLVKFFKEKVELKLNGIKTDTTIELTLSLNLVDTGEEILSTQEVIELD